MALLNVSNEWLDTNNKDSFMLMRNGDDDFDLYLPPFAKFKETEKLLDVITTEHEICRVVLSRRSTRSTLEVAYVLRIRRGYGSRNMLMDLPAEIRSIIFEPCLQYGRYTSPEKALPAPAALRRSSYGSLPWSSFPSGIGAFPFDDTEYTPFDTHLPAITAVSKQLRFETLDAYASLNHLHLTDESHKCLLRSDKIRIQSTISLLQALKKVTYTGHFTGFGFQMGLLLICMKERGYLHPLIQLDIRLHNGPRRQIEERYHFCRPQPIRRDLLDTFFHIGRALGRSEDISVEQWQQAQDQWRAVIFEDGQDCICECENNRSTT